MNMDHYFNRKYNASDYNCAHFACEVWEGLCGKQFTDALKFLLCGPSKRRAVLADLKSINIMREPQDPCIVYLKAPLRAPHVGVWIRGKVFHITKEWGVQYQPLDVVSFGFKRVRFLTC